jgi:hypothetical protein
MIQSQDQKKEPLGSFFITNSDGDQLLSFDD